jgi:hypothetical protein
LTDKSFLLPDECASYERSVAEARARLDEANFAAAWAEGRAMMLEQAILFALDRQNLANVA